MAPVAVRFTSMAVTPLGIVQSPLVPNTSKVRVSAGPTGRRRGPFGSAGRVSTKRHGAIGVTTDSTSSMARTRPIPPDPSVTATAAPIAAQRLRLTPRRARSPDAATLRPPWVARENWTFHALVIGNAAASLEAVLTKDSYDSRHGTVGRVAGRRPDGVLSGACVCRDRPPRGASHVGRQGNR